ncbi:helix-turn-helix domain-containing protein [Halomarina salina]|uniref:Helix-turn-helix domain-containing protein n=1 Tax=Halomarina salina TaxID=1872699 RepID=A0ABD5RK48_9EURY|nr:helix-turn-helix domain-containing protein [Halomarina salina]
MDGVEPTDGVPLTGIEREVLYTAVDEGYFGVPRRISTVELAEAVGVSTTALTEHLRRGMTKVLREKMQEERPSSRTER